MQTQTLINNEKLIQEEIKKRKDELSAVLTTCINSDTNDYFDNLGYYPVFDENTPVIKQGSNSNAFQYLGDGIISLKGAVFANGWDNTGLWEMNVDIYIPSLRYTGFVFTSSDYQKLPKFKEKWGIDNWEGSITENPRIMGGSYSSNFTKTPNSLLSDGNSGTVRVPWYTLHMKKTSLTTLEVWKNNDIENKVVYEWAELSDVERVTIGTNTNMAYSSTQGEGGSFYFKNLQVKTSNKKLIELCELTNQIQSVKNINTITPTEPQIINTNTLYGKEKNIYNKIQYCNNLLRKCLRKNGINFDNNCNNMEELIKKIATIPSIKIYERYVSDVDLDNNQNLVITYVDTEDLPYSNILSDISFNNDGNIVIETGPYEEENFDNLFIDLEFDAEGNIICAQVKDFIE